MPESFRDVEIEVARIWRKDQTNSIPLLHETSYVVFCFAEDDWPSQAVSGQVGMGTSGSWHHA